MNDVTESRQCRQAVEKSWRRTQRIRITLTLQTEKQSRSIYLSFKPAEFNVGILDQGNKGTGTCPNRSGSGAVLADLCGYFCCLALSLAVCGCSAACRLLYPEMELDEYPQTCIAPTSGLVITHVEGSPDSVHATVDILLVSLPRNCCLDLG